MHSYSGGLDNTLKSFDFNTTTGKYDSLVLLFIRRIAYYAQYSQILVYYVNIKIILLYFCLNL